MNEREDWELLAKAGLWKGIEKCDPLNDGLCSFLILYARSLMDEERRSLTTQKRRPPLGCVFLDAPIGSEEKEEDLLYSDIIPSPRFGIGLSNFVEIVKDWMERQGYSEKEIRRATSFLNLRLFQSLPQKKVARVIGMNPNNYFSQYLPRMRCLIQEVLHEQSPFYGSCD